MSEQFVVKHYVSDLQPTIKGNGFDGLSIGYDREEAEDFITFVNGLATRLDKIQEACREVSDDWSPEHPPYAAQELIERIEGILEQSND